MNELEVRYASLRERLEKIEQDFETAELFAAAEIERLEKALMRIVLDPEISRDEMLEVARVALEKR